MGHRRCMGACRRRGDDVDLADRQRRRRPGERSATDPGRPSPEHVGVDHVHGAHVIVDKQQHLVLDEHRAIVLVVDHPGFVVDFWPAGYRSGLVLPDDRNRRRSRRGQISTR